MARDAVGGTVRLTVTVLRGPAWFVAASTPFQQTLTSLLRKLGIDQSLSPSALVADAVRRSTKAHLFHFYPILCEIVSIPRKPPTAWVMSGARRMSIEPRTSAAEEPSNDDHAIELDARTLVKDCLKELGRELGVGY